MILARGISPPPSNCRTVFFLMGILVKSFKKVFRRQIPFFSKLVSPHKFFSGGNPEYMSEKWRINCRAKPLDGLTCEELHRNRRLCSDHFEDSQFIKKSMKTKLVMLCRHFSTYQIRLRRLQPQGQVLLVCR